MPAISTYAPGKIILFGEHAVVYNHPAIAIPVHQVRANVKVFANPTDESGRVEIKAPDINLVCALSELSSNHPFQVIVGLLKTQLKFSHLPSAKILISSDIPISAGLGSGTAVSVAMLKALANFLGANLTLEEISLLAFEVEKIYHGNPSGIDNTVIAYEKPIFFIRNSVKEILDIDTSMIFIIADTGIKVKTSEVVLSVQKRLLENRAAVEDIFSRIATITFSAKQALQNGKVEEIGALMQQNHILLSELGVSSQRLDNLVQTALQNGAIGAKLSGAGVGGNIIALVHEKDIKRVFDALQNDGAQRIISTRIPL